MTETKEEGILNEIKNLNENELYESAEILGSFIVSKTSKTKHASRVTPDGDALFD